MHQEVAMILEQLYLSTQQAKIQIAQLQQQLEESFHKTIICRSSSSTRAEADDRERRIPTTAGRPIVALETIRDQLDAELVSLRQVQGSLTAIAIDQSDKGSYMKTFCSRSCNNSYPKVRLTLRTYF